jgi:release factor glutamine methyltransferase
MSAEGGKHLSQSTGVACRLFDMDFVVQPDVFSPVVFPSTEIFTRGLLKVINHGATVLEVGCGAGVTAVVLAARLNCDVTGVDINPNAVYNTQENIRSCGCQSKARAVLGDMFDSIEKEIRFDYIVWNSNFMFREAGASYQSWLDYAFFDVGYRMHRRFFIEGASFLRPRGRQMLGFSTLGDWTRLVQTATEAGRSLTGLMSFPFQEAEHSGQYYLLDVQDAIRKN